MKRQNTLFFPMIVGAIILSMVLTGCAPLAAMTPPTPNSTPVSTEKPKEVMLTMGSWRVDDVEQMNHILAKFHELHPNITVHYDTYGTSDVGVYNPMVESMLKQGTAPDLFYLTSYGFSRQLYDAGYLEPLDDLAGLKENFAPAMLAPWSSEKGATYGVPFIATSHAIYYNQDIFRKYNLEVPETWEELLQTAVVIKAQGLIPFANASGEGWPMAEIVFMNLAPNFIGGIEGRMAYLQGQRCFNDSHMVATFQAVKDLGPYLPPNQKLLNYADSLQFFLQGRAVMWLGGSWDIPFFEAQKTGFEWSIFAVPPPANQAPFITFHLDAGMGLNANSSHKEEARIFLEWMTTTEFGAMLGNELPGFFPMHKDVPVLNSAHANTFLKLNEGREQDVRFTWEKIDDGTPSAYSLVMNGAIAVVNDQKTPQEAADDLQDGLAKWYLPAQKCKK